MAAPRFGLFGTASTSARTATLDETRCSNVGVVYSRHTNHIAAIEHRGTPDEFYEAVAVCAAARRMTPNRTVVYVDDKDSQRLKFMRDDNIFVFHKYLLWRAPASATSSGYVANLERLLAYCESKCA